MKSKILVFCDFYLPGFKSGGGMWTVVNIVDRFCDKYDFFIVTRNHDGVGDITPYDSVETGKWNKVGNANVYYVSNSLITRKHFRVIISTIQPDVIFLNSVFSTLAIILLFLKKLSYLKNIPIILAPCGELSRPALELKKSKKLLFLTFAKTFGLYNRIQWKASDQIEAEEIESAISRSAKIQIAPDLPPKHILKDLSLDLKPKKIEGKAVFCFVSRVVRKKNLHFLLQALAKINNEPLLELKIIGPLEDPEYWQECENLIKTLPENVSVKVVNGTPYSEVLEHLVNSHYFILPTLNENFGYVFIEAMAAGCPLLISDRTIWNELEEKGIGKNLDLDSVDKWTRSIETFAKMNDVDYRKMSSNARNYAVSWLADPQLEMATYKVLTKAMGV